MGYRKRGNPCKLVVEENIRQGAKNGNYLWIDSMPEYEVIMTRINGKITPMRFDELFNLKGSIMTSYTEIETGTNNLIQKVIHETKTITENIEVLDSDSSKLHWYKLNKVFRHPYAGEILRINTLDSVIDVSPNHPILVRQKGVPVVEAHNLEVGQKLVSRRPTSSNAHNNHMLFVGSEELVWLFGFFCAKGWVHSGHTCFSNKDKTLLIKVQKIILNNFHRSAIISQPRKNDFTLDCGSPQVAQYFMKQCYGNIELFDSTTKKVPISIINSSRNLKEAFIEGYFQGDGNFNKIQNRWTFTSTSRNLISGVIECLNAIYGKVNYSLHIRDDKPDIVQVTINNTNKRKLERDRIKKISQRLYSGWLYDIEVDSPDHTFYMGINNIRVHSSQDRNEVVL